MKLERYRQIAMELAAEIESGTYSEGDLFPTRTELAGRFKVTRTTVNRAVDILVEKTLITARRGAGSVVINTSQCYRIAYVAPEWLMRHIPAAPNCLLKYISYEEALGSGTGIAKLNNFDGILWSHPDEEHIPQIIDSQKNLPGTIINRAVPECNFVTTDHQKCFAKLVAERLAALPSATPYLLSATHANRFVAGKRAEGFIAACRSAKRFYEIIPMPPDFKGKITELEKNIKASGSLPLLIFADHWHDTGAVVQWVLNHKLRWKKDIYYVDFDNTEETHVWGIAVTSIIQDFDKLSRQALIQLQLIIKGPAPRRQEYIDPEIRYGDT
ncbi:MAG: GntR family transcriptional regulator [Victivallaceae bacterium]